METQMGPAISAIPPTIQQPTPASAVSTETFWQRADRIGSYIFAAFFVSIGFGAPTVLFIYSLFR